MAQTNYRVAVTTGVLALVWLIAETGSHAVKT